MLYSNMYTKCYLSICNFQNTYLVPTSSIHGSKKPCITMEYGLTIPKNSIQVILLYPLTCKFNSRSMLIIIVKKQIERIVQSRKKDTLSAENIREGTVKGRRFGPPFIICFFTIHIIWKSVYQELYEADNNKKTRGIQFDSEHTYRVTLNISSGSLLWSMCMRRATEFCSSLKSSSSTYR